jgi:hypothetical protein
MNKMDQLEATLRSADPGLGIDRSPGGPTGQRLYREARKRADLGPKDSMHRELRQQPSALVPIDGIFSGPRQAIESRSSMDRFARPLVAAAAAAALVAVLVVVGQSVVSPDKAKAAGFHFVRSGGYVYATIDDPSAPTASMQAAFDEANLNITVTMLPSSPSLAGTIGFMDVPPSFEPIYGPKDSCLSDGALTDAGNLIYTRCTIGVRVPTDFSGTASIKVNGIPPAGQPYETGADAFAPGELLHCSPIRLGMTVAEAVPILQKLGVTPIWIEGGIGNVTETSVENFYIRSANPYSLGTVYFTVQREPLGGDWETRWIERWNHALSSGC